MIFFFNDTATTEIYTSFPTRRSSDLPAPRALKRLNRVDVPDSGSGTRGGLRWQITRDDSDRVSLTEQIQRTRQRSEEHTSELQSRQYLVCRLLLEKKK